MGNKKITSRKSLQTECEQIYSILDNIDAVVYVTDMQTHEILFANKFSRDLFGEISGKICWQTIQVNQSGPCPFCTNEKLLSKEGKPLASTYVWEHINSITGRFYEIHNKAFKWIDGRLVRLQLAIDITERKQFEEALVKSEEKFHTFADYTYNWECWIDLAGHYQYISPSCQRVTGYSAQDFYDDPQHLLSIIHPEDREQFAIHLKNELNQENVHHCDFRIITPSGEVRWIAHSCQPVFDKQGNCLGRRVSNRDITRRKLAEAVLAESEAKFKNIYENSSIGISLIPLGEGTEEACEKKPALVNRAMQNFLGFSNEEICSKTLAELSHPDDMKKELPMLRSLLAGTFDTYKIEKRFIGKDEKVIWGSLSRSIIKDEQGRPLYIVSTIEDIQERKEAEEALQRSHEELESKVEERTQEIAAAYQKLEEEKTKLEEAYTALKVLLNRRENDKKNIENQVVANVKELVEPYLAKLRTGRLDAKQKKHVDIIAANLQDVISPFVHTVASRYLKLTATELQVANLVKQGRTTKEIAEIMNLSTETISNHRKKIRKKCGITNKNMNLRTLLSSFPE